MQTPRIRWPYRFVVVFLVPFVVPACGTQSLGGFLPGAADAGPGPSPTADAATGFASDDGGFGSADPCDVAGTAQGCEFYSVAPYPYRPASGSCFAAMLVNTGAKPVTIQAAYGAKPLDVAAMTRIPHGSGASITYAPLSNGELGPGEMAILFLSRFDDPDYLEDNDCPAGVTPGIGTDPAVQDTGRGVAFHITTSGPVAAFDMFPFGKWEYPKGIASASLLFPVRTWGTRYLAVDPYQADAYLDSSDQEETCEPFVQMVASENDTHVTIRPTADVYPDHGVTGATKGTPTTYTLAKGEFLQLSTGTWGAPTEDAATDRLMGSPVTSDKPITLIGGAPGWTAWGRNNTGSLPNHQCDTSHQHVPPTTAMGWQYAVARYRDRVASIHETAPYTVVGIADGTTLTYDPAPPADAPKTLNAGQVVIFHDAEAFAVRSQDAEHPFYLAGHMTGYWTISSTDLPPDGGEPEFVNALPPEQWLPNYTFLTDPTFRNTNLVFVRAKGTDGAFHDVTLDCAGALSGWAPIGSGAYEYTRLDTVIKATPQGQCADGPHVASSTAPFSLTVWAWDDQVAYAYPAGGGLAAINNVPLK